jgi:hypothetical protein
VYELADRTGFLRRFLIFGSLVSAAAELRDIDIVLIMENAAVRGEGSAFGLYWCLSALMHNGQNQYEKALAAAARWRP